MVRAEQNECEAGSAFERDLTLAESLSAPRRGPLHLVTISDVSGSDKSTLAQGLVESLGAVRLRSDVERKRLFDLPAQARPTATQAAQLYGTDVTRRTYERLQALATRLLDAGLHVIVDAACLRRDEREALRRVAAAHGAQCTLIECHASKAVLRERIQRRLAANLDASDANLAVLEHQLRTPEHATDDEQPCRLDTDVDATTLRDGALRWLGIA